jgi:hypothetical protein
MTRIYIRHIRALGLCRSGACRWAENHGINWSEFVSNGIDMGDLKHIDDPFLDNIRHIAEQESGNG